MKKISALLLAILMTTTFLFGCGDKTANKITGNFTDVDYKANEEAIKFEDSSEMPDWTGKQLDLTMWYANGSYSAKRNKVSENDVVSPEWQRVTGVKFSDASFDNNGDTQDAKISKIIATGEWPDVIAGCQGNVLTSLIEEDMLWDLTDLIPRYMPNLSALMENGFMASTREDGKIYEVDMSPAIDYAYPDISADILVRTQAPQANAAYVWVKDDILKMIKPEAYTYDEIVSKYQVNGGKFTEEEILNAAFNSKEEFYKFLRDIKALGLKVGNREIYPTYAFSGSDNWDFMSSLAGALNGFGCNPAKFSENYFTYYDVKSGKVELMLEQPFFKEILREFTNLVNEDVICEDSIVDNRAAFEEKCANGQYAILYGSTAPDIQTLNNNAQGYKFRPVIINIPLDTTRFVPMVDKLSGGTRYAFMKNEISEGDLAQVLRAFDFMLTDVGQKLTQWGPKSAGLFEETENGRRFTNKELEAQAVYGEANDTQLKYGLDNKQWPGYPAGVNRWKPAYIYDFVPNVTRLPYFYSPGMYAPVEVVPSIAPSVWKFTAHIDDISKAWDARTAIESAMTKILTATNEQEFETLYKKMVDVAKRNGLTSETIAEADEYWRNVVNKNYMSYLDEYLKEIKK